MKANLDLTLSAIFPTRPTRSQSGLTRHKAVLTAAYDYILLAQGEDGPTDKSQISCIEGERDIRDSNVTSEVYEAGNNTESNAQEAVHVSWLYRQMGWSWFCHSTPAISSDQKTNL
jgi:hypothetical protein